MIVSHSKLCPPLTDTVCFVCARICISYCIGGTTVRMYLVPPTQRTARCQTLQDIKSTFSGCLLDNLLRCPWQALDSIALIMLYSRRINAVVLSHHYKCHNQNDSNLVIEWYTLPILCFIKSSLIKVFIGQMGMWERTGGEYQISNDFLKCLISRLMFIELPGQVSYDC